MISQLSCANLGVRKVKLAYGKEIPTSLEELLTPERTALLVIDVQNDYAKENGKLLYPKTIRNLKSVIDKARKVGVLIIYVQDTLIPGRVSDSAAWVRHYMIGRGKDADEIGTYAVEGSFGHEVIDEIRPLPHEIMVKKFRSSAFVGTGLDLLLRSNNIRNVVVSGLVTEGCVESTCRDASNEYFVLVIRDCVDSRRKDLREACLKIMEHRYDVVTSEQVLKVWQSSPTVQRPLSSDQRVRGKEGV